MTGFSGTAGNDVFELTGPVPSGLHLFDGAGGQDRLDASGAEDGLQIVMEGVIGLNTDSDQPFGTITDFEHIITTSFDDIIKADQTPTSITIAAGDGSDTVSLGLRALQTGDHFDGGQGVDRFSAVAALADMTIDLQTGQLSMDGISGQALNFEFIDSGAGHDHIQLSAALRGGATGGRGNDTIVAGTNGFGDSLIVAGGEGMDLFDYAHVSTGYSIDLARGTVALSTGGPALAPHALRSIEQIRAGSGNDVIATMIYPTTVHDFDMGAGDDSVEVRSTALARDSAFTGGAGTDSISFHALASAIHFNMLSGLLQGTSVDGLVRALDFEQVSATDFDDMIGGTAAVDTIILRNGNDMAAGGGGNDVIHGNAGQDSLRGGEGDDQLSGGDGDDLINGDAGNDSLMGGNGLDTLLGGDGHDHITGGAGADGLAGHAGNDTLGGEGGDDRLFGQAGFDWLEGGSGNDRLDGGAQADNLWGGSGDDVLLGGDGFDRLFGQDGNDTAFGGDHDDVLQGHAGHDWLNGQGNNDRLLGDMGNDFLAGDSGDDTLSGGAGFDTLVGGTGDDLLTGNFNADVFVFADVGGGFGNDTLSDFAATNDLERIDLSRVGAITDMADLLDNHATQIGTDVQISADAGSTITLLNTALSDLDPYDFIF